LRCASALAVAVAVAAAVLAGCGSQHALRADLAHAVTAVRTVHDDARLQAELRRAKRRIAADKAGSARERRAKTEGLSALALLDEALSSKLAFIRNDSGNVEAATRDSKRAYALLARGGALLYAAALDAGARVRVSR
jgi:hypothetical protein